MIKKERSEGDMLLKKRFKDTLHDFNVSLYAKFHKDKPKKQHGNKHKQIMDMLFCLSLITLPLIQFCIFYIFVNFNSVLFAFRNYDVVNGYSWAGFNNFIKVFKDFGSVYELKNAIVNSLVVYAVTLVVSTPLCLVFSFYIYKKMFASKFLKIIIFLPTIISSIVFVTLYVHIADGVIPVIIKKVFDIKIRGLLSNIETRFGSILFYSIWCSFGSSVIIYVSTMSGISESITEAAKMDGITPLKEFIHITLPMIYPTFALFTSVGITAIFINQVNLFSFYGSQAEARLSTLGYYLYKGVYNGAKSDFPYLSAMGIIFTIIAVPLVYISKYLLLRLGPSEESKAL